MMLPVAVLLALAAAAGGAERKERLPKNRCLLYGEECPDRKDTILELIDKLREEIAKGSDCYTPEELRRLQQKLEDYEFLLDQLLYRGDSR